MLSVCEVSRNQAIELIEHNGGEVAQMGEVLSTTAYVVAGSIGARKKAIKVMGCPIESARERPR